MDSQTDPSFFHSCTTLGAGVNFDSTPTLSTKQPPIENVRGIARGRICKKQLLVRVWIQ
jgi:hypothetical protein